MRYGQIVMGPAGSGKSTYCSNVVKHCAATTKTTAHVVNLDPAAEHFDYPVTADVRDLIQLDDVVEDEELRLGPNGGLVFCMEHLVKNLNWLEEQVGEGEDDYFLFDCPGQIELFTHIPVIQEIVQHLKNCNFHLCGVFLLDSQFVIDTAKYFSGLMTALSTMVTLEIPHVNIMSKVDLLDKQAKKHLETYLDPDVTVLLEDINSATNKKFYKLNKAICGLIEEYSLVNFLPLDISDESSLDMVQLYINNAIQYGENLDVKVPREIDDDDDENDMMQDYDLANDYDES